MLLCTAPVSVTSKIFFSFDLVIVCTINDPFEYLVWHNEARACRLQYTTTKLLDRLLLAKVVQSDHQLKVACLRLVGLNRISAGLLLWSSSYIREGEIGKGVGVAKLAANGGRTNKAAFAARGEVRVALEVIGG